MIQQQEFKLNAMLSTEAVSREMKEIIDKLGKTMDKDKK